jgi:hypothetical protein
MAKATKKNGKKLAGRKCLESVKALKLSSNHNESLLRG